MNCELETTPLDSEAGINILTGKSKIRLFLIGMYCMYVCLLNVTTVTPRENLRNVQANQCQLPSIVESAITERKTKYLTSMRANKFSATTSIRATLGRESHEYISRRDENGLLIILQMIKNSARQARLVDT